MSGAHRPRPVTLLLPCGLALFALVLAAAACPAVDKARPKRKFAENPTQTINRVMARFLSDSGAEAAPRCDDAEFLRRASLDVIGRIATVEEFDRYFEDPPESRRGRLVERLLHQPEYARFWANRWATWLTSVSEGISPEAARRAPTYRASLTRWLEKELRSEKASYQATVERLLTATGSPEENGAVNFVLANLGDRLEVQEGIDEGKFDTTPLTIQTGANFLGLGLVCARCHDHPFQAEIKQQNFWELDACFRQIDVDADSRVSDNFEQNPTGAVLFEKRNGFFVAAFPGLVDEPTRKIPRRGQVARRRELARRVTSHRNFGPAFVDRMWGLFLGDHLVHGEGVFVHTASNSQEREAQLLVRLGQAFTKEGNDDPRNFIRWVCASDIYNRKAVRTPVLEAGEEMSPLLRTQAYERTALRGLPTEVYIESMLTALRPAVGAWPASGEAALREQRFGPLADLLGVGETEAAAPPLAALALMNNPRIQKLFDPRVSQTLQTALRLNRNDPRAAADHLYRAVLNRSCTDDEYRGVRRLGGTADSEPLAPDLLQDLFWTLVNSGEFALKH
jgi:hypothetical protein